ncbi:MAG: winged helix-turn-helix transcriptional regulator [Pseudolabrys sp.]|nr:winged helix-turn-helix transcriptional regulator [Pseudolabrys sp.]
MNQQDMATGHPTYEETDFADAEIALGVLDAVERNPSVTQRSVAQELGIALGLANAYLKRCVRKGLIKVSEVPARRYAYYLTPQGFAEKSRLTASYLSHSFSFFRRARSQCAEVFDAAAQRGQKRFVLLGGGDLADIALLVAREKNVDVAGIADAKNAAELQRLLKAFGQVDAVVITALEHTREALKISLTVLSENRVHVPELLRVRFSRHSGAREIRK